MLRVLYFARNNLTVYPLREVENGKTKCKRAEGAHL